MIQLFDYFNHAEIPNIFLCNPNKDELYSLTNFIYNDKLVLRFNAISEFEFDVPQTINNGITTEEYYPYIQTKRLIYIQNIGYFIIYDVVEESNGIYPTKKVYCRSIDGELITKKISAFKGTYKFYDPFHITPNIIDIVLDLIPSWSVGTIDSALVDKFRTFEVSDSTIYSFIMTTVEKAFQCVFKFDYFNKTISAYSVENATSNTDIFLSFENLIEKIELKEISDSIVTALKVFGGNELTIRSVNPLGGNIIYDFSYFKNLNWMSQTLIDKITAWEEKIVLLKPDYESLLLDLKVVNDELLVIANDIRTLDTERNALLALQQAAVTTVPPDETEIEQIAEDIAEKEGEIAIKQLQYSDKANESVILKNAINAIVNSLKFENNFTDDEFKELSLYIHENTFVNETIITTSIMTENEKLEQAQELYDQGVEVLIKSAQPRYEFSVNTANFIALKEFSSFTSQLELGAVVTIDKFGTMIETVLLEINMSFKNPTDFNLTFSNRLRLDNGDFQYSDLLGDSVSVGSTVNLNTMIWGDWSQNYRDEVSTFITSALDATTNNIINSTNQELIINSYGLRGRKQIAPGVYDGKEMWLTNNVLAFTDDNWQTSKLALGTIQTPNGTFSGLIADVIVGRILAGNSLLITNDDGTTTKTFTLDQNGAVLTNASFTLQNNTTKILLDPTNGIKIQKNTGTIPSPVWTDQFYVDGSGNAVFAGSLNAASGSFSGSLSGATGSFSGTVTATGGFIGAWIIDSVGLYNGSDHIWSSPLVGGTDVAFGDFVVRKTSTDSWMRMDGRIEIECANGGLTVQGTNVGVYGVTLNIGGTNYYFRNGILCYS